ncbi:MAG: hypothetical protein IIT48_04140, partial [Lachnospiraceae bacterium]|nr:hypothetical protein [Lachnospiraceae bacterium]
MKKLRDNKLHYKALAITFIWIFCFLMLVLSYIMDKVKFTYIGGGIILAGVFAVIFVNGGKLVSSEYKFMKRIKEYQKDKGQTDEYGAMLREHLNNMKINSNNERYANDYRLDLAEYYNLKGDCQNALKYLSQVNRKQLFDHHSSWILEMRIARYYLILLDIYSYLDDNKSVENVYKDAIENLDTSMGMNWALDVYIYMIHSEYYLFIKNIDESLENLDRAMSMLRENGVKCVFFDYLHKVEIYKKTGDYEKAISYYDKLKNLEKNDA